MRCLNFTEGPEIELLLGSDNAFLSPIEMDRYEDAGGGVVLYRSCLQNDILLLGGSRLIGPALVPKCEGTSQRGFRLTSQNNIKKKGRDAFVRRTVVKENDDKARFPGKLLPKMSKMDTQFCKEDADSKLPLLHTRKSDEHVSHSRSFDPGAEEIGYARLGRLGQPDTEEPWPEEKKRGHPNKKYAFWDGPDADYDGLHTAWNDADIQSPAKYTQGVVEKLLSERSFSIRYMSNKKIDRCERSVQGLSVIVKANDAKEVGTRDIVIDPLFPAGSIIDMPEGTDHSKGDALEALDDGRDEQQCENKQLPEDVAEGENATQPKKVLLKFVKGAEEMIKDLKR